MGGKLALRRFLVSLLFLLVGATVSRANQAARGWCESGAQLVITSGLVSTTQVQASYPSCTVTVFVHGGGLATLFSDNNATPTPLANPFTAQTNGQWILYAANGRYDIQLSGAGFPVPVTYSDVMLNDSGAGGVVFGVFNAVPFSPTPVFNAATASIFTITLTGNVTSSTVLNPVQIGQVIEIYLIQDAFGGHSFVFPANFTNTSCFNVNTSGNATTSTTWFFDGTNWNPFSCGGGTLGVIPPSQGGTGTGTPAAHGVAVGEGISTPFNFILPTNNGQCFMSAPANFATTDPSYQSCPTGTGGTSVGPFGTTQEAGSVAGTFAAGPQIDIGGLGTVLKTTADSELCGPNPYVDVRCYGGRALVPTATPAVPGITVTINSGSATATVSTSTCASQAASVCFLNGDGVEIPAAGTSHAMSTPTGVTVTPSLAGAGTGTGIVVNGPVGAVTYNYQVMAFNKTKGLTAASSVATTTTGASVLGRHTPVSNSTLTRSGSTVTVTTSTPHNFVVGCTAAVAPNNCGQVYISQTSDDINWGGWFPVGTVPDATHYTYTGGLDTRNGAPTSATGGVSVGFNTNRITWNAVTGAFGYCVYGRTGGALTWIGCTRPTGTNLSDLTFDDFGSPMMDNFKRPAWAPNSPPVSATPNNLVTTISSGAGTTTLTLAATASNTVTGGIIRFDNEPNILTAANVAANNNGMLLFPVAGSNTYVINSYLTLPAALSISQSGSLFLNDTVQVGQSAIWTGQPFRQGLPVPSFSQGENSIIGVSEANPGIYVPANTISNWSYLTFFGQGLLNGGQLFFADQVTPITIENSNFISSTSSTDYMGIGLILRGDAVGVGNSSFVNIFRNVLFSGGPAQSNGVTATPQFYCNGCGLTRLENINLTTRGIFFRPVAAGGDVELSTGRQQGGITPTFTYYNSAGNSSLSSVIIRQFEQDTTAHCLFNNMLGQVALLTIEGSGSPQPVSGANAPLVCGLQTPTVVGTNLRSALSGQNTNTDSISFGRAIDGSINTTSSGPYASRQVNTGVMLGSAYSLFTAGPAPAAPTAVVSSGGAILTGSHVYQVIPYWFNGGEGAFSASSNSVSVTPGNQTVTVTWSAVTPTPLGYDVYQDGQLVSIGSGGNCSTFPQYTGTSAVISSFVCGSSTTVPAGGPAGIHNGQVWGDFFPGAPNNTANALPSFSGGKLIATPCVPTTPGDLCYWNGSAWTRFAGNVTGTQLFAENPSGVPSWVAQGAPFPPAGVPNSSGSAWLSSYTAPTGNLVGTSQTNTWVAGIQDFSSVSELRPKAGTTASIPATCAVPDIYFATDAQPGRNWYFCTATNVWTQQVNTGDLGLNTYGSSHTLLATESWANFTATSTATIPHALNLNRWVVFCTSTCTTLTLAPDSGNITLNGAAPAATATVSTGLGVEVSCDGTNCFAYGLGGSGGGGSGTVASCTVNGSAYYTAATTVNCATPPTSPNGVSSMLTSTPSGGISQPPVLALPGIVGRAVSGIAATDTILATDCNPNRVEYVGSVAVAVTLPTATTLGVPKCVFKLVNTTVPPQTVTITPTTWTINGNATLPLTFGQQLWVYVDPNSATNWVADQTDLFGNVSGGAVPASAKLIGTNSSSQLIAAALANTHIYVGNGSNLPADVAASGDVTLANTGAFTVLGANGGTFPASASLLGTNSSKQPVTATAHGVALTLACADTSGSGSAQVCNTSPTFTPVAGDAIIYTTTTANSGAALTINVNSLGAKPVAKWQNATTLAASDLKANVDVLLTYDGTNWELATIGNAPSGGGGTPCTTTALSLQYNNGGAFGCVAEFTYASSTITASSTGKLDLSAASVTAGLLVPKAAGAAPTNGGIFSYDTTNNRFVGGNAVNTSIFPWFTTAPTTNVLRKGSGTLGLQVDSSVTDNGTVVSTPEPIQVGTANCTTFGTAGGICATEGTGPTNVSGAAVLYPDSTAHELEVATNGSTSFGMLVRSQPSPVNLTGQTALKTTTTACAASAGACNVAGQYHVHFNFWGSGTACSVVTVGSVQLQLTWTDENAVTHSAIAMPMWDQKSGALGTNFNFNTALATEGASGDYTISTNGTVIQYATTYTACSTGTGTYNLRLAVTRVQ